MSIFTGGKGLSFEDAVVVNANSSASGVAAEYAYVAQQHGQMGRDWERISQALRGHEGKFYDVLEIKTKDGRLIEYYFDISNFFGKY